MNLPDTDDLPENRRESGEEIERPKRDEEKQDKSEEPPRKRPKTHYGGREMEDGLY